MQKLAFRMKSKNVKKSFQKPSMITYLECQLWPSTKDFRTISILTRQMNETRHVSNTFTYYVVHMN